MGEGTAIAWAHDTFNPWWGCTKVSPACERCYAEAFSRRVGHGKRLRTIWGPSADRKLFGDAHWLEPERWNRAAQREGARRRVFCASMADVFEDHPLLARSRLRLWQLVDRTPALDWLLLTKRPQNIRHMVPSSWLSAPRANVWLGTTAENQAYWDLRVPELVSTPATVHFVSVEPMLGPIELNGLRPAWVICGGESGTGARPFALEDARDLMISCRESGIAFFMKQIGAEPTFLGRGPVKGYPRASEVMDFWGPGRTAHPAGADPEEWAPGFRVRELPGRAA